MLDEKKKSAFVTMSFVTKKIVRGVLSSGSGFAWEERQGGEAGHTQDWSPAKCRAHVDKRVVRVTLTHFGSMKLTWLFLDCGRKMEEPEKNVNRGGEVRYIFGLAASQSQDTYTESRQAFIFPFASMDNLESQMTLSCIFSFLFIYFFNFANHTPKFLVLSYITANYTPVLCNIFW